MPNESKYIQITGTLLFVLLLWCIPVAAERLPVKIFTSADGLGSGFVDYTVYGDGERIFDALCAGASGYLLKRTSPAKLLENIREAVSGGAPMSPEVASRVIKLFREVRPPERVDHDLTPHETRLLTLLVDGHNYTTAAVELKVSYNTIKFHIRHIYEKLQVHSESEAVAKALQNRIVYIFNYQLSVLAAPDDLSSSFTASALADSSSVTIPSICIS